MEFQKWVWGKGVGKGKMGLRPGEVGTHGRYLG